MMRTANFLFLTVLVILLSSCGLVMTPEERAAHNWANQRENEERARSVMAEREQTCRARGFQNGTDAMSLCVRKIAEKEQCYVNARQPMCMVGCLGLVSTALNNCQADCDERGQRARAACDGIYLPAPTKIIIQQQNEVYYPGVPSGAAIKPSTMNPFGR